MIPVAVDNIAGKQKRKVVSLHHVTKQFHEGGVLAWALNRPASGKPALCDISFDINAGEALGIIGPNGAGKSTLLRIISKIFQADSGSVNTQGSVAALLDVVSGLEPKLTGRENLRFLATLRGLSPDRVEDGLDRACSFSELGYALDRPVREYSNGMLLRLGFSMLTIIQAEIIILDEILAVGDLSFQRRCLQTLQDFRTSGRSLIMTSHDVTFLSRLCTRMIWLDAGRVVEDGDPGKVVAGYLRSTGSREFGGTSLGTARITRASLFDDQSTERDSFFPRETATLRLEYECDQLIQAPSFGIMICRQDWTCCLGTNSTIEGASPPVLPPGRGVVDITLDPIQLNPGWYFIGVSICDHDQSAIEIVPAVKVLEVLGDSDRRGLYEPNLLWSFRREDDP